MGQESEGSTCGPSKARMDPRGGRLAQLSGCVLLSEGERSAGRGGRGGRGREGGEGRGGRRRSLLAWAPCIAMGNATVCV